VAWGAVVLWLTGLLPLILEELDQIQWKKGVTKNMPINNTIVFVKVNKVLKAEPKISAVIIIETPITKVDFNLFSIKKKC
jgi:hypothetical protein